MLANTSTQMFFSPDPEDADLVRAALNSSLRYGNMTLDLPSLQCWLRARLKEQWQPPTLAQIQPLPRADASRVKMLMEEVFAAHADEYLPLDGWQERAAHSLRGMLPPSTAGLLDELLAARQANKTKSVTQPDPVEDPLRLGF